jgi:hypothetical protein
MFFPNDAVRVAALSELVGRWVAVEAYACNSWTLAGLIPSGTVVTRSVRYSMVFHLSLSI